MNIIIAGGGTGGHLFPGIATAEEFRRRSPAVVITFIGTPQGLEARVVPKTEFELKTITATGFRGKGIDARLRAVAALPRACTAAGRYMRQARADVAIGFGGYVSFPTILAAWALRVPTAIHEQNSVPGLSNRILGCIADRVFVSYETSRAFFHPAKTVLTGMPVRQCFLEARERQGRRFCVLVVGGSQGSHAINLAIMEALPVLARLRQDMRFIHQAGHADRDMVTAGYARYGFEACVTAFIDDMEPCYREAHLVICRAGAATLAELAACGRASVLIPYPFAAGNHQEKNAAAFQQSGAALVTRAQGELLASAICELEYDRARVASMENAARSLARARAAASIVDECCRLLNLCKRSARC